jgi:hypothetical protein
MKSCYFVPIIFICLLLSGYIIMGYTRHCLYGHMVENHIAERISSKNEGLPIPMGWETHEYLGSPEAARVITDPVFQEEIYFLCDEWLEYSTEYQTDVLPSILEEIDDDTWCLWDAYKQVMIFDYLTYVLSVASGPAIYPITPHNDEDWGGSLAESIARWEAAGNSRQGDWMERYKQSSEYEAWQNHVLDEIAEPEGYDDPRSIEELYQETTKQVEIPYYSFLLQKDKLEMYRRTTKVAYERYITHVNEKDIVRASVDSWVVRFVSLNFSDTATRGYSLLSILKMKGFPLRNLIVDFSIIISLSIVLTCLIWKKILMSH